MFVSIRTLFDMTTRITLCPVNVDIAHRSSTVPRAGDQAFDFSVLICI